MDFLDFFFLNQYDNSSNSGASLKWHNYFDQEAGE